ncbi:MULTISPECIES: ABC transporter ATP-binding protein [Cellulosimicrobium]|uniref:ATP-binding cassette domain-containing protein n=1 Tax=Cellulosimicrobium sp. ES-005 TaxID=3163031 RepID=A0AAU8FVT2_9MICO|nr:ATP-binding cassette domain-containing protein [Cellulosimicrobium cellulans]MCO7273459.1 ATP-binding cassette domain-containing protein [Cellulosimicrobium cellulans]
MSDGAARDVVLSARRIEHAYGADPVLRGVDLDVVAGEVVALMGPSGSGKSTLLHLLAGLLVPDAGQVRLLGRRLDTLGERARAQVRLRDLGFVFQFGDLVPELTVVENVELPLRLLGTRRREARSVALGQLDLLGIADLADRRLVEVSGGQAQRAAVARALVHRPAVVLADEPTGALDTVAGELVLEALVGAARDTRTAVLLVTHEVGVAAWADRDVQIRDGRVRPTAVLA